jgi:GNAT superfamily N-acetyltransferase
MIEEFEIRESLPSDAASIEKLYPDAFPDEDLLPLVKEFLREEPIVLSLVGIVDRTLVGHVIFTTCSIAGRPDNVSLLGPLAVGPAWQRRGIGSALVREGLRRLENAGVIQVYVRGMAIDHPTQRRTASPRKAFRAATVAPTCSMGALNHWFSPASVRLWFLVRILSHPALGKPALRVHQPRASFSPRRQAATPPRPSPRASRSSPRST